MARLSNGTAALQPPGNGTPTPPETNGAAALKKDKDAEKRRNRRKQKSKKKNTVEPQNASKITGKIENNGGVKEEEEDDDAEKVEIEYISEKLDFDDLSSMDPLIEGFKKIFEKFQSAEETFPLKKDEGVVQGVAPTEDDKKPGSDEEDEDEQDLKLKEKGLSNKKKKLQRRMKIAELKQLCSRPDVVEIWDATAADPKLLVYLKAYRNTVPVPRHWCQKRKYLQAAFPLQLV